MLGGRAVVGFGVGVGGVEVGVGVGVGVGVLVAPPCCPSSYQPGWGIVCLPGGGSPSCSFFSSCSPSGGGIVCLPVGRIAGLPGGRAVVGVFQVSWYLKYTRAGNLDVLLMCLATGLTQ